jgi:hypothetical protein
MRCNDVDHSLPMPCGVTDTGGVWSVECGVLEMAPGERR